MLLADDVAEQEWSVHHSVVNMTFTRTDWRRSQLSIEPTRSQNGCVDQELSQLRGFSEIYIRGNDEVLSVTDMG
jgi:hypothetical protein